MAVCVKIFHKFYKILQNRHIESETICVDLDGTLINTDTLVELFIRGLKHCPHMLFLCPFWLLKGKINLKLKLSFYCAKYANRFPFNEKLVSFLREEKRRGKKIYLATACEESLARSIVKDLDLFEDVFGTSEKTNLKAENKAELLVSKFGEGNFAYAGNSASDLEVWKRASEIILVNAPEALSKRARLQNPQSHFLEFPNKTDSFRAFLKTIRIHQWAKNILIFVPLFLSHQYFNAEKVIAALLAFFALSFCASATYIFNDILDIENDRAHKTKKNRPIASGSFPASKAFLVIFAFALLAAALSMSVSLNLFLFLLLYVAATLGYSFFFKRIVIVDVIVLSSLYLYRIYFGAFATGTVISFWLVSFSILMFFSLGSMKRYIELQSLEGIAEEKVKGRAYVKSDISTISTLGISAGMMSSVLYILYVNNAASEMYLRPDFLLIGSLLFLYFISKTWLMASRRLVHDDPVIYAIKTGENYVLIALFAAIFILAGPI